MIRYEKRSVISFNILFSWRGSAIPSMLPMAFLGTFSFFFPSFPIFLAAALWAFILRNGKLVDSTPGNRIFENPGPALTFMTVVSMTLGFYVNQSYNRFWEARTRMQVLTGKLLAACSLAILGDEQHEAKDVLIHRQFKKNIVHLSSLFHAVCISYLYRTTKHLSVIGGLSEGERNQLAKTSDQALLVFEWLIRVLTLRLSRGGFKDCTNLFARIVADYDDALQAFYDACKLEDTPFPFPYVHLVQIFMCFILIVIPLMIVVFQPGLYSGPLCSALVVSCFQAIAYAGYAMESPFGDRANDIPLKEIHDDADSALLQLLHKDDDDQIDNYINLNLFSASMNPKDESHISEAETQDEADKIEERNDEESLSGASGNRNKTINPSDPNMPAAYTLPHDLSNSSYNINLPDNENLDQSMQRQQFLIREREYGHNAPSPSPSFNNSVPPSLPPLSRHKSNKKNADYESHAGIGSLIMPSNPYGDFDKNSSGPWDKKSRKKSIHTHRLSIDGFSMGREEEFDISARGIGEYDSHRFTSHGVRVCSNCPECMKKESASSDDEKKLPSTVNHPFTHHTVPSSHTNPEESPRLSDSAHGILGKRNSVVGHDASGGKEKSSKLMSLFHFFTRRKNDIPLPLDAANSKHLSQSLPLEGTAADPNSLTSSLLPEDKVSTHESPILLRKRKQSTGSLHARNVSDPTWSAPFGFPAKSGGICPHCEHSLNCHETSELQPLPSLSPHMKRSHHRTSQSLTETNSTVFQNGRFYKINHSSSLPPTSLSFTQQGMVSPHFIQEGGIGDEMMQGKFNLSESKERKKHKRQTTLNKLQPFKYSTDDLDKVTPLVNVEACPTFLSPPVLMEQKSKHSLGGAMKQIGQNEAMRPGVQRKKHSAQVGGRLDINVPVGERKGTMRRTFSTGVVDANSYEELHGREAENLGTNMAGMDENNGPSLHRRNHERLSGVTFRTHTGMYVGDPSDEESQEPIKADPLEPAQLEGKMSEYKTVCRKNSISSADPASPPTSPKIEDAPNHLNMSPFRGGGIAEVEEELQRDDEGYTGEYTSDFGKVVSSMENAGELSPSEDNNYRSIIVYSGYEKSPGSEKPVDGSGSVMGNIIATPSDDYLASPSLSHAAPLKLFDTFVLDRKNSYSSEKSPSFIQSPASAAEFCPFPTLEEEPDSSDQDIHGMLERSEEEVFHPVQYNETTLANETNKAQPMINRGESSSLSALNPYDCSPSLLSLPPPDRRDYTEVVSKVSRSEAFSRGVSEDVFRDNVSVLSAKGSIKSHSKRPVSAKTSSQQLNVTIPIANVCTASPVTANVRSNAELSADLINADSQDYYLYGVSHLSKIRDYAAATLSEGLTDGERALRRTVSLSEKGRDAESVDLEMLTRAERAESGEIRDTGGDRKPRIEFREQVRRLESIQNESGSESSSDSAEEMDKEITRKKTITAQSMSHRALSAASSISSMYFPEKVGDKENISRDQSSPIQSRSPTPSQKYPTVTSIKATLGSSLILPLLEDGSREEERGGPMVLSGDDEITYPFSKNKSVSFYDGGSLANPQVLIPLSSQSSGGLMTQNNGTIGTFNASNGNMGAIIPSAVTSPKMSATGASDVCITVDSSMDDVSVISREISRVDGTLSSSKNAPSTMSNTGNREGNSIVTLPSARRRLSRSGVVDKSHQNRQ